MNDKIQGCLLSAKYQAAGVVKSFIAELAHVRLDFQMNVVVVSQLGLVEVGSCAARIVATERPPIGVMCLIVTLHHDEELRALIAMFSTDFVVSGPIV
jgi:hypothetical protein